MEGQAEERGKIKSFTTIKLTDLKAEVDRCTAAHKFMFIADMSGQAYTYFRYNTEPFELHGWAKRCSIKKEISKEEVSEEFRRQLVNLMRVGNTLVVHLDTMVPQLKTQYDNAILPLKDMIFDRPKLDQNYKQLLKAGEDFDKYKNKGMYSMDNDFNMAILSNMSDPDYDDEILQMVLDQIDHIDDFEKFYVAELE